MAGSRRHPLLDLDSRRPFGICFKGGSFNTWKCFFFVENALFLIDVGEGYIGGGRFRTICGNSVPYLADQLNLVSQPGRQLCCFHPRRSKKETIWSFATIFAEEGRNLFGKLPEQLSEFLILSLFMWIALSKLKEVVLVIAEYRIHWVCKILNQECHFQQTDNHTYKDRRNFLDRNI